MPSTGSFWQYSSAAGATGDLTSSVVTTAVRQGGPYDTQAVSMDQDGAYDNAGGAGPQEWN